VNWENKMTKMEAIETCAKAMLRRQRCDPAASYGYSENTELAANIVTALRLDLLQPTERVEKGYDMPRAGDLSPLRFVPKGTKRVALVRVSTKVPDLEPRTYSRSELTRLALRSAVGAIESENPNGNGNGVGLRALQISYGFPLAHRATLKDS
jgi:hypothetical protein